MKKLARFLKSPIFVWWDITRACNLNCKQCYSASGKPAPDELSFREVLNIIDQLRKLEIFYIYFLGGEPLMRENIFDIFAYCSQKEIYTMMSTNGWFVDTETAQKLRKTGIRHVRVSLDGATADVHDSIRGVPGSFDRAVEALENLKKAGIPMIGVSPTLMVDNFHQVGEIIDLSIEKGAGEIQVVQLCKTGRGRYLPNLTVDQIQYAREEVKKRISKYANHNISATEGIMDKKCRSCVEKKIATPSLIGCVGARSCAAINFRGVVSPCILYRKKSGDLRKDSFKKIWDTSPLFLKMREVKGVCHGCDFSDLCVRECILDRKLDEVQRGEMIKSIKISIGQETGCYQMGITDCFIKI
jgi:radical SAM protein with 4Fe4S-binding SPASM domain